MNVERREREFEGVELDPRVEYEEERLQPVEEIKTISLEEGRIVKIGI